MSLIEDDSQAEPLEGETDIERKDVAEPDAKIAAGDPTPERDAAELPPPDDTGPDSASPEASTEEGSSDE